MEGRGGEGWGGEGKGNSRLGYRTGAHIRGWWSWAVEGVGVTPLCCPAWDWPGVVPDGLTGTLVKVVTAMVSSSTGIIAGLGRHEGPPWAVPGPSPPASPHPQLPRALEAAPGPQPD